MESLSILFFAPGLIYISLELTQTLDLSCHALLPPWLLKQAYLLLIMRLTVA